MFPQTPSSPLRNYSIISDHFNNVCEFGLGLNWGRPPQSGLDDQYTAEIFYRFQLTRNLAITPDMQLIIDPALNPQESSIWVFGLRARLAL